MYSTAAPSEDPLLQWLLETKQMITIYIMVRIRGENASLIRPL